MGGNDNVEGMFSTLQEHFNTMARWTKTANFTANPPLLLLPRHQWSCASCFNKKDCSLATNDFSFSNYKLS